MSEEIRINSINAPTPPKQPTKTEPTNKPNKSGDKK